jgi:hypothetical protein
MTDGPSLALDDAPTLPAAHRLMPPTELAGGLAR